MAKKADVSTPARRRVLSSYLIVCVCIFVNFRVVLCHSPSLITCWPGFSANPCLSTSFSRLTASDI